VQCPPIKFRSRCGQERTQWKQRHAARYVSRIASGVNEGTAQLFAWPTSSFR
jgi:hypothetical protein